MGYKKNYESREDMPDVQINLLQHFAFCPRQWGLMEIEGSWSENAHVVSGNILHKKVDNPFNNESRGDLKISRGLSLHSEKYGLVGIADCVEFEKSDIGIFIPRLKGKYIIRVIEYKNGRPHEAGKINFPDALQVAAQIMCLEEMFGADTDCPLFIEGYVFYNKIKRRVAHKDLAELKLKVVETLALMRHYMSTQTIPEGEKNIRCKACSLVDICLPKIKDKDLFMRIKKRENRN